KTRNERSDHQRNATSLLRHRRAHHAEHYRGRNCNHRYASDQHENLVSSSLRKTVPIRSVLHSSPHLHALVLPVIGYRNTLVRAPITVANTAQEALVRMYIYRRHGSCRNTYRGITRHLSYHLR